MCVCVGGGGGYNVDEKQCQCFFSVLGEWGRGLSKGEN